MERELRAAKQARERARAAARDAAASAAAGEPDIGHGQRRPSDEELGIYSTDDSIANILADARAELSGIYGEARRQPIVKRVGELIDELAAKLTGGDHRT